ncbi:uncharacterized protein LOC123468405 [Daphnia magna]|uniref:uncharacterized protein LOC123468405 n=1 Tax=Daphnia magna TaxID=35525 RepID=UPI001E1BB3A6|nr:uncharacterized protein LOC123468405 [Daphnia magna]
MTSDTTICSLKLSKFAEGLVPEEKKLYCDFLKELGCVDPLTIPLSVYKSEKKVKEVLPPIKNKHLVLYLVIERNGSDGEKFEAYKNLNGSPQYVDNTFADKLLAFPLPNGIVIIRSHITHSQSLGINPTTPWAAIHSDGKVKVAYCDCAAGLGRVCIHVSALLQLAVAEHELPSRRTETAWNADEDQVAPTSKACEWNKPGKGPVTVGKVADLSVIKKRKHVNVVIDNPSLEFLFFFL